MSNYKNPQRYKNGDYLLFSCFKTDIMIERFFYRHANI